MNAQIDDTSVESFVTSTTRILEDHGYTIVDVKN